MAAKSAIFDIITAFQSPMLPFCIAGIGSIKSSREGYTTEFESATTKRLALYSISLYGKKTKCNIFFITTLIEILRS